eukprot:s6381_g1.t2
MTAWAAGAEWKSCVSCKQYVASNSSLIVCRECWGKGRKPQADRVEQLGDGVIVTTTPLGTRTSGASRGRGFFIRNEHRDELVGWLKTRGADLKHVTLHAIKGKKAGNFGSLFCGVFFICERTTALTRSPKIGMY